MNAAEIFARLTRMMDGYVASGATGDQIANAYRATYRALHKSEDGAAAVVSLAMLIEDRADEGSVWADAFEIMAA